jgi:hypothetical protein
VRVTAARSGWLHPAGKADILGVLRFFGEAYTYGLRTIMLVPAPEAAPSDRVMLGALHAPGEIRLYDQPVPPWVLPGELASEERGRLERAGALVTTATSGLQTVVRWPGATLRDFMLFDGLMHEIGHHWLQQYRGKRRPQVQRTRDHERFAERFAQRCRRQYLERTPR